MVRKSYSNNDSPFQEHKRTPCLGGYSSRKDRVAVSFTNIGISADKPCNKPYPKALITIGDYIRKERLDKNLTQKDVAIHVGVTMEAVTYWEKGTIPQIQYVPRIVSFLGYDPFVREGNSLVDLVRNYKRKHGLTLKQIAKLAGIDSSYLGRVLKDKYTLSNCKLERLESILAS